MEDLPDTAGASEPVIDVPMYAIDPLVRRASSLQRTRTAQRGAVDYAA
jgi:hypothetical protein